MYSVDELEDRLIDLAFAEDIGDGDHTTLCCIPDDATGKSHLLIKEDGILAGIEVAKRVFARFDSTLKVDVLIGDGAKVKKGDIAMVVSGKTRSLLQTERSSAKPCAMLRWKSANKLSGAPMSRENCSINAGCWSRSRSR